MPYSAGIAFGGADTKGTLALDYASPTFRLAGGNGTQPVWNLSIHGTSGLNYNLDNIPKAQQADNATHAGTADNATNAGNINNTGTVTLATATEANQIDITQPIFSPGKPVKLLNFNWYNDKYSIGAVRGGSADIAELGMYLNGSEICSWDSKGVYTAGRMQADSGFYGNVVGTLNGYTAAQLVGEVSHATNGYHKFPGGTIIQWGYAANNGSYSFPIAFPNACLNVSLTAFAQNIDGGGDNGSVVLVSKNVSGFTYTDTDDRNDFPVSYIAIGY